MTTYTKTRRLISLAIATALVTSLSLASTSLSYAKSKKAEAEKAELSPSKNYRKTVGAVQDALEKAQQSGGAAEDLAELDKALKESEKAVETDDDRFFQSQFTLQYGLLTGDTEVQAIALDGMIDSGRGPAESLGGWNYHSGAFAYNKDDYAKVVRRMTAAQAAGYDDPNVGLLLMDSHLQLEQLDKALAVSREQIAALEAKGEVPDEALFIRPAQALLELKRYDEVIDLLTRRLAYYPAQEVWNNTLEVYMQIIDQTQSEDRQRDIDMFRLLAAAEAIEDIRVYSEYANLAAELGLPGEAVQIIDKGRSAGIIPSPDEALDELYEGQSVRAESDKVDIEEDVSEAMASSNTQQIRRTADALFGYGDYARAASLYQRALTLDGVDADMVNLRLGLLHYYQNDMQAARAAFERVSGARQPLARFWLVLLTK